MKKWIILLFVGSNIISGCSKTPEKILLNNHQIEYNKDLIKMIDIRSSKYKIDGPCKCPNDYEYVIKFVDGKKSTIFGMDVISGEKDIKISANVENEKYYEHTIKDDGDYEKLIGLLEDIKTRGE